MELNKCPNCSGKLEMAPSRKKMICPYCGSEFSLDESTDTAEDAVLINKDWFNYEWNYESIISNPKFAPSINYFIRCLNEYDTPEAVEDHMRTYMIPMYSDVSAPGIHEENMSEVKQRIQLNPGEHIVLYYDDGLFSHGKTGFILTDKRIFMIEKKNVKELTYANIPFIYLEYSFGLPMYKLGDKYGNNIPAMGNDHALQGAAAAYVCHSIFKDNPNRIKINLTSK